MAEIKQKLICPMVPNFIFIQKPTGKKQDGFYPEASKISIADLSDETLEELAYEWQNNLIKQAHKLRECK